MKRVLVLSFALLMFTAITAFAQAPALMNYQGIARNSSGQPMVTQALGLRITIHNGSQAGNIVYQETQTATTNAYGLYTLQIGAGAVISGSMSSINWASNPKYIQVEMDPTGGSSYTNDLGSTQLLSVPYSLYAASAGNVPANIPTVSGTANFLPIFTGANTLGNSGVYQSGNYIGIGTTAPLEPLHVQTISDTIAALINDSANHELTYGILRAQYIGTYDQASSVGSNVAILGTTLSDIGNQYGFGVEGAGAQVGVLGLGESEGATETHGAEGDSYNDNTSIGVAGFGISATGSGTENIGVYGSAPYLDAIANYAAYFDGDVYVNGTLSKAGGAFKIDDPMDPANKYLYHSFVESPDMMDVYNGNITTDANGTATVTLPAYFDKLNKDFRYQLTVIGTFAQAIVGEEVHNNQFVIKTNQPDVKVSWQVTGIRQDPWANAHRIPNEIAKEPINKGKYLNAKEYGMPASLQIGHFKPNAHKNDKNILPLKTSAAK